MIFKKPVRIPLARIGALIGKSGKTKDALESICDVKLDIDSETGEILVTSTIPNDPLLPFKAVNIVNAIGRGFSPSKAFELLKEDYQLHILDLRDFTSKSPSQIERVKSRLIGTNGKARRNLENLTGSYISVYGRTVSVISTTRKISLIIDAITSLCSGSVHRSVYRKLESVRHMEKQEKMILWEGQNLGQ